MGCPVALSLPNCNGFLLAISTKSSRIPHLQRRQRVASDVAFGQHAGVGRGPRLEIKRAASGDSYRLAARCTTYANPDETTTQDSHGREQPAGPPAFARTN